MLKIGDNLSHFSCQDDKGNLVTHEDFKGKNVILFFYPRGFISGHAITSELISEPT